jgi:hypothetical protein
MTPKEFAAWKETIHMRAFSVPTSVVCFVKCFLTEPTLPNSKVAKG